MEEERQKLVSLATRAVICSRPFRVGASSAMAFCLPVPASPSVGDVVDQNDEGDDDDTKNSE